MMTTQTTTTGDEDAIKEEHDSLQNTVVFKRVNRNEYYYIIIHTRTTQAGHIDEVGDGRDQPTEQRLKAVLCKRLHHMSTLMSSTQRHPHQLHENTTLLGTDKEAPNLSDAASGLLKKACTTRNYDSSAATMRV
eukprot:1355043-Amphidinium_carterae.8